MAGQPWRIEAVGLNAVTKKAREFAERGALDAVKAANYEAALLLVKAAQPLAPTRSGKLRSSIRPAKAAKFAAVYAGSARVPYAAPIHFGWFYDKEWFIKKNIKPNPFLYRAFGYKKEQILQNYVDNMEKAIKKYQL